MIGMLGLDLLLLAIALWLHMMSKKYPGSSRSPFTW